MHWGRHTGLLFSFLNKIYLIERQSYTEREKERERSSICRFTPQMAITAGAGPIQNQEPRAFSVSPPQEQGPKDVAILHCFPRHISMQLEQKWSSWGSNQHSYPMLALQMAGLPAAPQHRPHLQVGMLLGTCTMAGL